MNAKSKGRAKICSWRFIATLPLAFAIAQHPASAQTEEYASANDDSPQEVHQNIKDPAIQAWHDLTYDQKPPAPVPGKDYGLDPETGKFNHPKASPLVRSTPSFEGQLDYWDSKSYAKNVEEVAFYPYIIYTGHMWQNIRRQTVFIRLKRLHQSRHFRY